MKKTGTFTVNNNPSKHIYKYGDKLFTINDLGKEISRKTELILSIDMIDKERSFLVKELEKLNNYEK